MMNEKRLGYGFSITIVLILLATAITLQAHSPGFTDVFMEDKCTFSSTGRNPFFILEPGFELVLEGEEDGENVQLIITVLDETKVINGIETRVVRERETHAGELVEISKNYFAICKRTNSVFYFGEDVNFYENGTVVSHEGSWRAGANGATAGIIMPGTLLLGARYMQEVAPEVALDRAEIVRLDSVVTTPFGNFTGCLQTKETTALEPNTPAEFKFYAAGVGLIKEKTLQLAESALQRERFIL